VIDVVLPPLRFVKALNRNPWDTRTIIGSLETPILFISGLRDELVPPPHVKRLHDEAVRCRIKHFYVVENGTHNDTWFRGGARYRQAIRNFVDTVISSPPVGSAAAVAGRDGDEAGDREAGFLGGEDAASDLETGSSESGAEEGDGGGEDGGGEDEGGEGQEL
jgi:hypothetical protein